MNKKTNNTNKNYGKGSSAKKNFNKGAKKGKYQEAATPREKERADFDTSSPHTKFPSSRIGNDPKWYFKDEKILQDVASFSYSTPLGVDIRDYMTYAPTGGSSSAPSYLTGGLTTIPGVMAIQLAPVPGIAVDAQDPVNLAAQNIYTFIRYKNSGHANYDAPDLMLYLLAMDSAYTMWNWMKRIYGYTSTYSQVNRYKPRAYAAADNVDLDDVYLNLADFRAYLNMAAGRLSAFCVPAVMTYMVRHSWLFSNIWTDAETRKAQNYMYVPSFYYQYDETSSPKGGKLVAKNILYTKPSKLYTVNDLISMLDGIINALQYSEDIGIMSGDILKAYGEGSLFTVSTFDADYRVDAAYHRGVLSQIENSMPATVLYQHATLSSFDIVQDPNTNYIKFQPTASWTAGQVNERLGYHLNFHWDNPTAEDVIEATRLMWTGAQTSTGIKITSCGSEIPLSCDIYYYAQADSISVPYSQGAALSLKKFGFRQAIEVQYKGSDVDLPTLAMQVWLSVAFDWCPEWREYYTAGNNDTYILPPVKDWDVYTLVDNANIDALNLLALLSEFNVPA